MTFITRPQSRGHIQVYPYHPFTALSLKWVSVCIAILHLCIMFPSQLLYLHHQNIHLKELGDHFLTWPTVRVLTGQQWMLCEGRAMGRVPRPGQAKRTTWLCLQCLCLSSVSGFTCAVSVTTTLSLSATRHDTQYSSAGTRPITNLWLSPVGAAVKCGSMFYLETL